MSLTRVLVKFELIFHLSNTPHDGQPPPDQNQSQSSSIASVGEHFSLQYVLLQCRVCRSLTGPTPANIPTFPRPWLG
jgi:hypothetical protein